MTRLWWRWELLRRTVVHEPHDDPHLLHGVIDLHDEAVVAWRCRASGPQQLDHALSRGLVERRMQKSEREEVVFAHDGCDTGPHATKRVSLDYVQPRCVSRHNLVSIGLDLFFGQRASREGWHFYHISKAR